jgi:hypothetical protein
MMLYTPLASMKYLSLLPRLCTFTYSSTTGILLPLFLFLSSLPVTTIATSAPDDEDEGNLKTRIQYSDRHC